MSALHKTITYYGIGNSKARGITVLLSVFEERFPYGIQILMRTAASVVLRRKAKRDRCWGSYVHRWRLGSSDMEHCTLDVFHGLGRAIRWLYQLSEGDHSRGKNQRVSVELRTEFNPLELSLKL